MYVSLLQHLVGKLNDEVDLTNLIQVWSESLATKLLCFKGERTLHSSQDALELTGARKPLTDLNPQKGNYWGQRINSKWDKTIIKQRRTRTLQKNQKKNVTCHVMSLSITAYPFPWSCGVLLLEPIPALSQGEGQVASNVGFSVSLKDTSACSSTLPRAGIWTSSPS